MEIFDDGILEMGEDFNLELRFDPFGTPPSGVILQPSVATVFIQDDDSNFDHIAVCITTLHSVISLTSQMPSSASLILHTQQMKTKERFLCRLELLLDLLNVK